MDTKKDKQKNVKVIILFAIGLAVLVAGGAWLGLKIYRVNHPDMTATERLVEVGAWGKEGVEGVEGVIWTFTEIGKGSLTTNNHLNDYDFIWSLEDKQLKIETSWLGILEDEFVFEYDNSRGCFSIMDTDETVSVFCPVEQTASEDGEK